MSRARKAMRWLRRAWVASICCGVMSVAQAGEVRVAVAANFAPAFDKLAALFAQSTAHQAVASVGSTGKFYTQIKAGAPFDVLLSADVETPRKLEDEGLVVKGSRFTYARGRLVLWSAEAGLVDAHGQVLRHGRPTHLAIANPRLAPYGAAAVEVLQHLGVYPRWADVLVMGDNVAQAAQFVATGNAPMGLVAWSAVQVPGRPVKGSWWLVPESLHSPLRQDAALLTQGQSNPAAQALLAFLKTDQARTWMRRYGYAL